MQMNSVDAVLGLLQNSRMADPQHWRDRAAEMRVIANIAHDIDTSRIMLKLAADYEKLAERAACRSNGLPVPTD
jgi:hypothetical protein